MSSYHNLSYFELKDIAKLDTFTLCGFITEEREGTGGEVEVGSY